MIPIARNVEKCNFEKIEKKLTFEKFGTSIFFQKVGNFGKN